MAKGSEKQKGVTQGEAEQREVEQREATQREAEQGGSEPKEIKLESLNQETKKNSKKRELTRKMGLYGKLVVILLALTVTLNICSINSTFCDWYKLTVYGMISDDLGKITAWMPFPLGEILGYLGVIALAIGVILLPLLFFFRRRIKFRKFTVRFWKGIFLIVVIMFFVYTLNWIIPFRGTVLKVKGARERTYSIMEIQTVRNYLVEQLNACAKEVERDENGRVIYDREKMTQATFKAMQEQAKDYPLLAGYYPPMKGALCSDFLNWMNIGGYTYPYTMEITWNVYCTDFRYPTLLAHESSHHQGYYQENEANFIAFLACTQSEDPLIRYAGYDYAYAYVEDAYVDALYASMERNEAKAHLRKQPMVSHLVRRDRYDAEDASKEKYEAVSHPAQQFEKVSVKVADVGWETQAKLLEENYYDDVVEMILDFYDVANGGLDHDF